MTDIELTPEGQIILYVDTTIYNGAIIDKVLYWYVDKFLIKRQNEPNSPIQTIILSASTPISQQEFTYLSKKLSTDFIDYKNRFIIAEETRDLRNILYAKAFANSDDFKEFDFED